MRFFVVSVAALRRQPALAVRLPRLARPREDRRAGARDRPRDAAELPREQALVVPPLRLVAALALAGRACSRPRAHGRRGAGFRRRLTREQRDPSSSSPTRRSPRGSSATRPNPATDATFAERHVDGERLVGRRGRDRDRQGRRRHRRGARGLDRAAGRVEDGARRPRRLRRQADQQLPGLARRSAPRS